MLRDFPKGFYLVYIPMTILAFVTVGLLIAGVISPYYLIGSFIMWILVCGLGIACGYHRVFSHHTHKLPTWKENIILFFAVFAGQINKNLPYEQMFNDFMWLRNNDVITEEERKLKVEELDRSMQGTSKIVGFGQRN